MPGTALAQDWHRSLPASIVAHLVDDTTVLRTVDEYELTLGRRLVGAHLEFQCILIAAECNVELEVLDFTDVTCGRVIYY